MLWHYFHMNGVLNIKSHLPYHLHHLDSSRIAFLIHLVDTIYAARHSCLQIFEEWLRIHWIELCWWVKFQFVPMHCHQGETLEGPVKSKIVLVLEKLFLTIKNLFYFKLPFPNTNFAILNSQYDIHQWKPCPRGQKLESLNATVVLN